MRYLGLPLTIYRLRKTDLQPLEEKIVGKISMATWKNVNMAGCRVLVRAVLNSHAIYHLTSIALPKEVMKRITTLLRAYLWIGCDKVIGGKHKVNWETVLHATNLGGLGVMHLEKFATTLRLRWLNLATLG